MTMPILFLDNIIRVDMRRNPDRLYVFGDNLDQKGLGGQARECRGEPNAIGIPTKRAPSMAQGAFFSDADYHVWLKTAEPAFNAIETALRQGKTVVFPRAGLGTGLSELATRAPEIKAAIDAVMEVFKKIDRNFRCERTSSQRPRGRS